MSHLIYTGFVKSKDPLSETKPVGKLTISDSRLSDWSCLVHEEAKILL